MEIVQRKPSDLIAAEYNPRSLNDNQFATISDSLKRFGFVDPVLVNKHPDRNNIIIGGHQRTKVAKSLGLETIPTVELSLTLDQEKELNIRLNKNTGEFDMDALNEFFETDDLIEWGFDAEELDFFEPEEEEEVEEDDFNEEPPEEPKTELGRIYQLGNHRLMCGDSTSEADVKRLMDGELADMVFTDPPYGVAYKPKATASKSTGGVSESRKSGCANHLIKNDSTLEEAATVLTKALLHDDKEIPYFICCDWKSYAMMAECVVEADIKQKACIIWDKGGPFQYMDKYSKRHEFIIYCGPFGGQKTICTDIWQVNRVFLDDHPTPKPIGLIDKALVSFMDATIIVDYFGGSGSTLIACEQAGRQCRMMELDPKYCDVIVKRYCKLKDIDPETVFETGVAK